MIITIFSSLANATTTISMPYDSFSKLWDLGAGIVGALIGVVVGAYVSVIQERDRRKREIDKIHLLLQDDFSRLNDLAIEIIDNAKEIKVKLTQELYVKSIILNIETLKITIKKTILPLKFAFWKSLESSGSLIKLEPREIQLIQSVHDYIEKIQNNSEEEALAVLREAHDLEHMDETSKRFWIGDTLLNHIKYSLNTCQNVYNEIAKLGEIGWLRENLTKIKPQNELSKSG